MRRRLVVLATGLLVGAVRAAGQEDVQAGGTAEALNFIKAIP